MLESGCAVLQAGSAEEAVPLAGAEGAHIALLLTDVGMPGLSGPALAERLVAAAPGLRVLYMSGYTEGAVVQGGTLQPRPPLLAKPFTPDALVRQVREVLDGAAGPPPAAR